MVSPLLLLLLLLVGVMTVVTAPPHHEPRNSPDDVLLLLWTRSNPGDIEYMQLIQGDEYSLGHFNGDDPTVVLIHGFSGQGYEGWVVDAKTELLKLGSYNVISVDWAKLAEAPWYPTAVGHVREVGITTAHMLDWLHEAAGMEAAGVQVVGHSLGAHVAGAVGQNLKNFRLPFITGNDPAGPEYYSMPNAYRLDKTDADFVQIIHTNAGSVADGCVGLKDKLGHVDFYPNGGDHQPGCTVGGDWMDLLTGGCSHGRSHKFWLESINGRTAFVSHPCTSWDHFTAGQCSTCDQGCLEMGFHVDRSLSGTYYLTTNKFKPYAQGM